MNPRILSHTLPIVLALLVSEIASSAPPSKGGLVPLADLVIPDHVATLPAEKLHPHVEKTWAAMKERLKGIDKKKTELIFIGDSITAGWNGNRAGFNRFYGKYAAENFAIGADTTHGVLRRIKEGNLDGFSPKAVVMLIGVNNAHWGGHSLEESVNGILKVAQTIRKKLPETKVLMVGLMPRGDRSGTKSFRWQKGEEVNALIQKYADQKNFFYFAASDNFLQVDDLPIKGGYRDGVHLNSNGLEIWAGVMQRELEEIIAGRYDDVRDLDLKVSLPNRKVGAKTEVWVECSIDKALDVGSQLEFVLPAGFQVDRESATMTSEHLEGELRVMAPVVELTVGKGEGRRIAFTITGVTNPGFATSDVPFLLKIRGKDGSLLGLGKSVVR